jgi:choice-of-anchor C domain-containing protein
MRQFGIWILGGAIVASLMLASSPAQEKDAKSENLLTNGSFEDGPEPEAFKPLDADSTDIKGWKVTRAQIDYIGNYWMAANGKRCLDLHGSPGIGGVSQTFKTTKGQKYRVTLYLAGNPDGSVAKKTIKVKAADKEEEFDFDVTGKSKEEMGWQKKTMDFRAEDDETTLEIYSSMTEDEACGPALDNVSVVPIKN